MLNNFFIIIEQPVCLIKVDAVHGSEFLEKLLVLAVLLQYVIDYLSNPFLVKGAVIIDKGLEV